MKDSPRSMYVEYYYRRAISLTGMRWIIQFLINHLTRNSGNLTLAASSRLSYSMQYFLMQTSATAESGYMPTRLLTAALKMIQFFVKIVTQHLPHSPFAIRYTSTWFLTRKYPKNEWHKKKYWPHFRSLSRTIVLSVLSSLVNLSWKDNDTPLNMLV